MMSWSAIVLAGALASIPPGAGPLHLQVSRDGDSVVLAVVGESASPASATYELEVDAGKPGAINHSVQRGNASLQPGKAVTIARLRVGNSTTDTLTAILRVTPSAGNAYEESWRSPPGE